MQSSKESMCLFILLWHVLQQHLLVVGALIILRITQVADVVGTVTLDGKPLEGASITFAPQSGRSSSGVTDSSGRYSLNYTGSIRGAMLGSIES